MVVEEHEDLSAGAITPKVESILDRRRLLKRQRRNRFLQSLWRTGTTFTLAVTIGVGLSQPEWKIRSLEQVSILGNTQLSTQTLEQLLPLTYPSSLIRVQPQKIAEQLKSFAHVQQAVVSRQLFPPHVTVVVQERSPVATARCAECVLVHGGQTPLPKDDVWLIDLEGIGLPLASYPERQQSQSLPSLEIEGYFASAQESAPQTQGQPVVIERDQQIQLQKILPPILASSVPIQRLDLRDATNLKILTQLGWVHLAQFEGDPNQLKAQLEALDKLRSLPDQVDLSEVQYIDLSDPARPTLTLKPDKNNDPQTTAPE